MIILPFGIICSNTSYSQQGNPYITNLNLKHTHSKQMFSISQDENGVMFFANRSGILKFDGEDWELIQCKDLPAILSEPDKNGTIFVGCENNIGFLDQDDIGRFSFISFLPDSLRSACKGIYTNIITEGPYVYFYSFQRIIKINRISKEYISQITTGENLLKGIFKHKKQIYVNTAFNGLCQIKSDSLVSLSSGDAFQNKQIIFYDEYGEDTTIIGTNNNLFLFARNDIKNYKITDSVLVRSGIISGGIVFTDSLLALSTYSDGCIIINKNTGKSHKYLNAEIGLPDDEVYTIFVDKDGALWIAHSLGLSRAILTFPITVYHSYKGLSHSKLFSLLKTDDLLLVGSGLGLFRLEKNLLYDEEISQKIVRKKVYRRPTKPKPGVHTNQKPDQSIEDNDNDNELDKKNKQDGQIEDTKPQKRKGLFNFLKKILKDEPENEGAKTDKKGERSKRRKKKTRKKQEDQKLEPKFFIKEEKIDLITKKLRAIEFKYNKYNEFNDKTDHLCKLNDSLFIGSSNTDIFLISKNSVTPLVQNKYIYDFSITQNKEHLHILTSEGVYYVHLKSFQDSDSQRITNSLNHYTIESIDSSKFWIGGNDMVHMADMAKDSDNVILAHYFESGFTDKIDIKLIGNKTYFLTQRGLYSLVGDSVVRDTISFNPILLKNKGQIRYHASQHDILWINAGQQWFILSSANAVDSKALPFLNVFENINHIFVDDVKNIWLINDYNSIYCIENSKLNSFNTSFLINLKKIYDIDGNLLSADDITLERDHSSVRLIISAPNYLKNNSTRYSYIVNGLFDNWSDWTLSNNIQIPYLPPGSYTIQVKAKNILGKVKYSEPIDITVLKPIWLRTWFIMLVIIILIILVYAFIKYREQKLLHDKMVLETKVKERTIEIERQRDKIESQNKDLKDSIEYARKIQQAMIPGISVLNAFISDSFVIFRPRDIVSGDFYWASAVKDYLVVAAVDCTGHGVPGAFMSMLGISMLNEIVAKQGVIEPSEILNRLRDNIIKQLHQSDRNDELKDGMDLSLCLFDKKNMKVSFSGAYNPVYHIFPKENEKNLFESHFKGNVKIRENENGDYLLYQYLADRMPIGIYYRMKKTFTTTTFEVSKGDTVYMFSDGYADQIGGPKNRKFMPRRFREKLLNIQSFSMTSQKEILENDLNQWQGDHFQIDDILVIGIRI